MANGVDAGGATDTDTDTWYSNSKVDEWFNLPTSAARPSPRYKHATAVIADNLYAHGGSRNARNLSDFQVLDLNTGTWSPLSPNAAQSSAFPATSAHHLIVWEDKLLIIQGKSDNSKFLTVRSFDLATNDCTLVETTGDVPVAREGESVTLVDSKLIVFGGEDNHRKLMNDLHILHLHTMSWEKVQATQPPPSPRYDHATAVHAQRYLLVFGGCSHSTCFNDLYVLDLNTLEWSQPETGGDYVAPRAGHSGVTINGFWYIVGGGDNKSGALETIVLDMAKLVWSVVATVNPRDPLASEGISICSAVIHGERYLVAFGGYNGKYNNEVFVMRPKLKDSVQPKIYKSHAAAAAAASVSAAYSIDSGGKQSDVTKSQQPSGIAGTDGQKVANGLPESSLAEVRSENSLLRGKIDDLKNTHAQLSKELMSVQGQLEGERSRCSSLEVQISQYQHFLEALPSIEARLERLRNERSTFEQAIEDDKTAQRQGSGGVWQWFSGGGSSP